MIKIPGSSRWARRRILVPAAAALAGVAFASAAWACVPASDRRTLIQNCAAPSGSPKVCKPMLGTPAFPNATSVKGPSRSILTAFVNSGLDGATYDLVFVNATQLANGTVCRNGQVINNGSTPAVSDFDGGVPPTAGTIPANSPLGRGQVCFSDTSRVVDNSDIATFKVTL